MSAKSEKSGRPERGGRFHFETLIANLLWIADAHHAAPSMSWHCKPVRMLCGYSQKRRGTVIMGVAGMVWLVRSALFGAVNGNETKFAGGGEGQNRAVEALGSLKAADGALGAGVHCASHCAGIMAAGL